MGEIDYPDGGKKTFTYTGPNNDYVQTPLNSSTSGYTYHDTDAYGRADRISIYNGQSSNQWYQQDSCFDTSGRVHFQTYSYQGTGLNGTKVCSGAGDTTAYDALGRVTSITHADNTAIHYSYTGRATKVVDENGVTRIIQVDGLGRTTSICEVSSSSQQSVAPVNCGQDIAATGFLTTYTYSTDSSKDQVKTIIQGAASQTDTCSSSNQCRTFVSDSLGRTVSVTEPERGATAYSYTYSTTSGLGLLVTRKRPQANQTSLSVLTTTTTQYDSLGRVVSVNYDDNLTPRKLFDYDVTCCAWTPSITNVKGRLSVMGAELGSNTATLSGSLFSYDAMGRVLNVWECTPSTCGTSAQNSRSVWYNYDWAGNVTLEGDSAAGAITYGRSPAGEITSVTNNTYTLSGASGSATLLSNPVNGPNGPISYNFGNGLSQFNSYDTLGRINGGWVCAGAPSGACSNPNVPQRNGFYVYWSGSRAYASGENYVGQGMTYQYDDFNRLTGMKNSAGTATYTYDYDLYGNRVDQNALQGGGSFHQSYSATTNQLPLPYTYDAAGNMTHDASGGHNFTYDAEGNILQVDAGQSDSWTFVFDALNHRVRAQYSGGSSEGIYDIAGHNTSGWSGPTTPSESHIFADSLQIAFRSGDGNTYFTHKNWLGTDRVTTDLNGATGATYTSLPFGDGGSENVSESYAGWDFEHFGDMDVDSWDSTYHAQFRNYSELQARWLSPDPYDGSYDMSNPQSFNRYSYVLNNPLSFIDPSGLCPADDPCPSGGGDGGWLAGIGAAIAAGISALFGFGGPSFNGSLQPRPTVSTTFSSGYYANNGIYTLPATVNVSYSNAYLYAGLGAAAGSSTLASLSGGLGNPCSLSNPANLDYSQNLYKGGTQNSQQHILQNHTPGGKGPSFYAGDFSAIQVTNGLTLLFGGMGPAATQQPGTYTLQFTYPQIFEPLGINYYIGTGANGQPTATNRLVVMSNCSTVVTSYPIN